MCINAQLTWLGLRVAVRLCQALWKLTLYCYNLFAAVSFLADVSNVSPTPSSTDSKCFAAWLPDGAHKTHCTLLLTFC